MGVSLPAGTLVRTGEERATLVRRAYSVVFASILVTIGGAAFGLSQPSLMETVVRHPFLTFLLALAPLLMATRVRQTFPANLGFVFLFTFIEGVWISPLVFMYERMQPGIATQAAYLTIGTFGVLTAYAFVSRRDFSAWGGFFVTGLWVLIGTSLLNLFFHNETASLWIAAAGMLVFSGLLLFDTWRLRNVYGPNDYVQAAVAIYLDLLNMFLFMLRLLGGRRN
jgi:FtsH-binding integral membrane protein